MKIILLMDVKKLGKKGEVVSVNDGYAANFLIPRKMAVKFTDQSEAVLVKQQEEDKKALEKEKALAIENQEKLKNITLNFQMKASPDGRMTGTVSYKQIAEELKNKHNIIIDKRRFVDKYLVNAFGFTRLKIELFKGVIGVVNVHVSEIK